MTQFKLTSIALKGYRPFRDFTANVCPLEVLVGANGSGKSSLFEFLRFLRDSVQQEIPPEIVTGASGQQLFHSPGPARFVWQLQIQNDKSHFPLQYEGELFGPVGQTQVTYERVTSFAPEGPRSLLEMKGRNGTERDSIAGLPQLAPRPLTTRPNQLALSLVTNAQLEQLYNLRDYIRGWRFYNSFKIATEKIRKSVSLEQEPVLHEDAGNLSAVLHYFLTEHPRLLDDLHVFLRGLIPGFERLTVKARGGPGEVIAFWKERGVESDLSLADLSDGTLRLLCWCVVCLHPNPPGLVCIDEPDQGVHPRTLPLLAGMLEKLSDRTQVFVTTHSSYFLIQFPFENLAVMRKENGQALFVKPKDSQTLLDILEEFGPREIELMHRNDELEVLA